MAINRFNKVAIYFMEVPKYGAGIMPRELTSDEVARLETRRAFAIRWVRDGSPAYCEDLLPGDIITHVNGNAADEEAWQAAIQTNEPLRVSFVRGATKREIALTIPEDWRPK